MLLLYYLYVNILTIYFSVLLFSAIPFPFYINASLKNLIENPIYQKIETKWIVIKKYTGKKAYLGVKNI